MSFSYSEGAKNLYKALYKIEEKDDRAKEVIKIIKDYRLQERIAIKKYYDGVYAEKTFEEDVNSQLKGNIVEIILYLFTDPIEYDCNEINKAFTKLTYNKENIYEIITSRPYWMLQKIKKKYEELYKAKLDDLCLDKFNEVIGQCLIVLLNSERQENKDVDENKIKEKYKLLKDTPPQDWLKNLKLFETVFAKSSPEELIKIGRLHFSENHNDFLTYIEDKLTSKEAKLLTEVIYNTCRPFELFAKKIKQALNGFSIDNKALNRIYTTRNEIDMKFIRKIYQTLFGKNLKENLDNSLSGDYKNLLIELTEKQI